MGLFRKRQQPEYNLFTGNVGRSATARSTSPFSLSKTLSRTSIASSDAVVDDPKGPLGLTLLSSPPDARVDLVFVHGLGGGSRKTWSRTPLRTHYWPQEWLPQEPGFQDVRIHSYGYDSDYLKGKEDCLNIHHIGKSFLGALSTSPCFMGSKTRIIAVGHSMGGLVIKKAYILGRQDAAQFAMVDRFTAIYFLATPHRGSDSAKLLKNILRVASERAYVGDLERNSGAIQVINDEFRHVSSSLELWSFYETQVLKPFDSLIVDSESAVLGYREEKQIPLNADHRSICKFDTRQDPNYIALRNALASTVTKISAAVPEQALMEEREQIRELRRYLNIATEAYEDDFFAVSEARIPDSCGWVLDKEEFSNWTDGKSQAIKVLWVKGKPATGKSVLTGFIINQLRTSNRAVSFYFFKHGDKSKSRLSGCTLSLAFQMAVANDDVRQAVLQLREDYIRLDRLNERTLWRILFTTCIFKSLATSMHFWAIDALDECANPSTLLEFALSKQEESPSLRILITSRNTTELDQGWPLTPSHTIQFMPISISDTLSDFKLMIETQSKLLGVVGPEHRATLVETILAKSRGSFLWTILVLKELMRCHSIKEITQVLEDVPRGMESLYQRILDSMSQNVRGRSLAQAILLWVTCAVRPLTTDELSGALSLDIQDDFPRLEESIALLCGELVVVDKHRRIHMVHETAREFLVSSETSSEFAIDRKKAHSRMAKTCLVYLVGEEMRPPRSNRRRASTSLPPRRNDFCAYACTAYSYHLSKTEPMAMEPFQLAQQFFKANVLSWIEAVSSSEDLSQLSRASKHLKLYINACSVERSPLDHRIQTLRQWVTDLTRVSAMFAAALTESPAAIYSLIPPFCPNDSAIHNISIPGRKLEVLAPSNNHWDDRLASLAFRQGQPSVVCYGDEFLAVGMTTGETILYYATSFQEYKLFDHGESVKFIAFKSKTQVIATCGMRTVKLWDIRRGVVTHNLNSPQRPLCMAFKGNMLLVASHKNFVASWDLGNDASPNAARPWTGTPDIGRPPRRSPCALAISASHGLLAVAYSGQPISLWDMDDDAYIGSCGKKNSAGETSSHVVVSLAINPNPTIELLAVAYLDGDLALLDPFADEQLECFRANRQTLAASPNGRLLAAGGGDGLIQIYEFDTFRLLYRVKSSNSFIKQLTFARDNLRLADIRGAQCTIWEPEALLRDSLSDDSSGMTSTTIVETISTEAKAKITAIANHPTADVIFCGKDDETVVLYDRKTAGCLQILYSHKSSIRLLAWCKRSDALISVDASNRIFSYRIQTAGQAWSSAAAELMFQTQLESENAILTIIPGEYAGKFVVSTRESSHLFNLIGEHEVGRTCLPGIRKWIQHPQYSSHLICADREFVSIFHWHDFSEVASFSLSFQLHKGPSELKGIAAYSLGREQRLVLEFSEMDGSPRTNSISVIDLNQLTIGNSLDSAVCPEGADTSGTPMRTSSNGEHRAVITPVSIVPLCSQITAIERNIAHVIGISGCSRLVFLDPASWVCSVDLREVDCQANSTNASSPAEVSRHFFVPFDWFAGKRDLISLLAQKDILLTRSGDLAIIRSWAEHSDMVAVY